MKNELGPRPAANEIRFDRDCFGEGPEVVTYWIGKSAPNYPERYDNEEEANRRARILGRSVEKRATRPLVRIKWK